MSDDAADFAVDICQAEKKMEHRARAGCIDKLTHRFSRFFEDSHEELFNLEQDLFETTNLVAFEVEK